MTGENPKDTLPRKDVFELGLYGLSCMYQG
jgi:hypothetical protein